MIGPTVAIETEFDSQMCDSMAFGGGLHFFDSNARSRVASALRWFLRLDVLVFGLLQPLGVGNVYPAEPGLPIVQRRFLRLARHTNLLFREPCRRDWYVLQKGQTLALNGRNR